MAVFFLLMGLAGAEGLEAQQELPAVPLDSLELRDGSGASPGGAFLRAVLLPGWGHAAIGSYNRGAFYFTAQAGTAFGYLKTQLRLGEARDRRDLQRSVLTRRLEREGVTDPDEIEAALEEDEGFQEVAGLVEARQQQQEDWVALGIFLLFLGGADAFVSAHLQDFPDPLELQIRAADTGAAELTIRVPLP